MTDEKKKRIAELEKKLSYLISPEMTAEKKMNALKDAFWRAHNAGYCDAMAGRLMGGKSDWQTDKWELDCRYKTEVELLLELLSSETEKNDA